jgi:predicted nucleic acid-binding protein
MTITPYQVANSIRTPAVRSKPPTRDALIAAPSLVHGMAVVTRNVDDLVGTGVNLLNP